MATTDSMPTSSSASSLPKAGEIVSGKYRIVKMIAEGGMGVVFEAMHIQLDEKVAIKFLRTEFTGPQAGELSARFIREARTSAKIKSEHVVRVHDVGATDTGAPYIVMEHLTGQDLEQLVDRQGSLPIAQAIDFVLQACEALAEAHAIGIVHRDLKPANLFLTHRADGSHCVKVLDFGISKFKDVEGSGDDMGMTKTHAVMGSPRYMSPEQMRSSKDVDPRADVWAIGVILYELFAGTVPFDGTSMPQICAAILEATPKNIRLLRPEITAELDAIITKCLAKKPEDRFGNVAHLARALSAFGSPIAQSSADRIGRVLRASLAPDMLADIAPRDFMVQASSSPTLPAPSNPSLPGSLSAASHDTSGISATAGAWTGSHPGGVGQSKRKRVIALAASMVLVATCLAVAGAYLQHRASRASATSASQHAAEIAPVPISTPPAASSVAIATVATENAAPIPTPTAALHTEPEVAASAAPTTAKIASVPKKPPSPPAHPPAAAHTSSPPATQSASPSDMWGERK